jgi:hypothetical protein
MDTQKLQDMIANDLKLGLIPSIICATAGTTNLGKNIITT